MTHFAASSLGTNVPMLVIAGFLGIGCLVILVVSIAKPEKVWRWKHNHQFANPDQVKPSDFALAWTRGTSIIAAIVLAVALIGLGVIQWGKSLDEQREDYFGDDEIELVEPKQVADKNPSDRDVPVELLAQYFPLDHDAISLIPDPRQPSGDLLVVAPFEPNFVVVEENSTSVNITVYGNCLRYNRHADPDEDPCGDELHKLDNPFRVTYAIPIELDEALKNKKVIDGSTNNTLREAQ